MISSLIIFMMYSGWISADGRFFRINVKLIGGGLPIGEPNE